MRSTKILFSILLLGVSNIIPGLSIYGGNEGPEGGDAVFWGDKVLTFDEMECSDHFMPDDPQAEGFIRDAWQLLDPNKPGTQLAALKSKMPSVGAYLQSFFASGRVSWCFTEGELKEIKDEGPTSLVVTFEHQQVAVNQKNNVIIRHDLAKKMPAKSFARLMIHEILWSALEDSVKLSGDIIRQLSSHFMNPHIGRFDPTVIADHIHRILGERGSETRLAQYADFDKVAADSTTPFYAEAVPTPLRFDTLIVKRRDETHPEMKITTLNPNPSVPHILSFSPSDMSVDVQPDADKPTKIKRQPLALRRLCTDLNYANTTGWRLPTLEELKVLWDSQLLGVKALKQTMQNRVAIQKVTWVLREVRRQEWLYHTQPVTTSYAFPLQGLLSLDLKIDRLSSGDRERIDEKALLMVASDGKTYNLGDRLNEYVYRTHVYDDALDGIGAIWWTLIHDIGYVYEHRYMPYPKYFCVKD